jgi:uncharacterized protein YciI
MLKTIKKMFQFHKFLVLFTFSILLISSQKLLAQENSANSSREFVVPGPEKMVLKKYFMVFLMKDPNRTQDDSTAQVIQAGHLAHINKMSKEGYLHMAGPFEYAPDSNMAGILIFDVDTEEEALRLVSEDPAIKAGRLQPAIAAWWCAKNSCLK